jgi:hypothetical protein
MRKLSILRKTERSPKKMTFYATVLRQHTEAMVSPRWSSLVLVLLLRAVAAATAEDIALDCVASDKGDDGRQECVAATGVNDTETTGGTIDPPITVECGVYMAPSTLGEATNMGIYTGKAMVPDEVVNFPEIAIPLLFREWGTHRPGFTGTLLDVCCPYLSSHRSSHPLTYRYLDI